LSKVFVLDTNKRPLNPVHPGRARILLSTGKAAVIRRYPFTLILKQEVHNPTLQPLRVKIDPGSKITGMAIVNDASSEVVWAAELSHRGHAIQEALDSRRATRCSRRARHTRYRKPRFNNRTRLKGWLPPSLRSRVDNIAVWIARLMRYAPISEISLELVKFDTQAMQHPEIGGEEYQQGTLAGYEIREYLLEKWDRQCAYCGRKDIPLEIEHIQPRANGGTNRISNLCLSCESCNIRKGTQSIDQFLHNKPDVLKRILAQTKAPLKDTASVNATRWTIYERLKWSYLPIECGSGGLTKYNRTLRKLPKTHWLDAACVGKSTPDRLSIGRVVPLLIKATGRQSRQMCRMDKYGFPRTSAKEQRTVRGFQTGDIVRAIVPTGKKAGTYTGRLSVRSIGSFNIQTKQELIQGISYRYCVSLHKSDGYSYQK
jgi:5-methylcytosine-specific restriction endonuclease McrA